MTESIYAAAMRLKDETQKKDSSMQLLIKLKGREFTTIEDVLNYKESLDKKIDRLLSS